MLWIENTKIYGNLKPRAKGRKIHGNEDAYQLREGQTNYGAWQDFDNNNTFDWNLAN